MKRIKKIYIVNRFSAVLVNIFAKIVKRFRSEIVAQNIINLLVSFNKLRLNNHIIPKPNGRKLIPNIKVVPEIVIKPKVKIHTTM